MDLVNLLKNLIEQNDISEEEILKTLKLILADAALRQRDTRLVPPDPAWIQTELFSKENRSPIQTSALLRSETNTIEISFSPEERYRLLKTLGEGGMGIVQLVQDRVLRRNVALKKIKMSAGGVQNISETQQVLLWRLYREAMITAHLEHPNIVPIYEMQQNSAHEIWFTMRKIEGQTFRELLRKKRTNEAALEETKLLLIFQKVCDAVAYAHAQGVIHRDLKPDNVMIGSFGEVYVMDWGLAKKQEETQAFFDLPISEASTYQTIGGMGTMGYMPPEQKKNAALVTLQADIYALGKILEECFTGIAPYEKWLETSKTPSTVLDEKKEVLVPLDIQAIVEKATRENPLDRYVSVQEMANDLEHYANHSRVSVREYKGIELLQKWIRRNQKTLALTGILFGFSLSMWFFFRWNEQKKRNQAFQNHWKQALSLKQQAEEKNPQSRNERFEKMQHLINALNALNKALFLKPYQREAEAEKYNLAKELLELCYQIQDYPLARYIVSDLQEVALLETSDKQKLKDRVQEEQSKTILQHQKRLEFWIQELQKPSLEKGMRENAIFEMSKMIEPEIVERMKAKIQEGTRYFLSSSFSTERNTRLDELYMTMVLALGRQENPQTSEFFLQELQKMEAEVVKLPSAKRQTQGIQHMIHLAQSLAFCKAEGYSKALMEIRQRMGLDDLFSYATELPYKSLILLDLPRYQDPKSENEFYERGLMKKSLSDYAGALDDFSQAIQRASKNSTRSALYNVQGFVRYEQGLYSEAIVDFTRALEYNANNDVAYGNRAMTFHLLKKINESEADYQRAIEINPNHFLHYRNRGLLKKELLDFENALADYDRALQLNPQDIASYTNRGILKYLKKDFDGALKDFNQAIEFNPQQPEIYTNRAAVYQSKGNLHEALSDFSQAIYLNPQDFKAYYNRSLIKYFQHDHKGAIQDLHQSLLLNPNFIEAYVRRAEIKINLQEWESALEDYNQVLLLDPTFKEVLLSRARVKVQMNDFPGAFADYTQAIQMDPQNPKLLLQGALIAQTMKNHELAITWIQQSLTLNPLEVQAYILLGESALQLHKVDLAIHAYIQVLERQPSAEIIDSLATLLFNEIIRLYRDKQFSSAKDSALLFQKYIPREHPKRNQVDQMLHKIETLLK